MNKEELLILINKYPGLRMKENNNEYIIYANIFTLIKDLLWKKNL